MKYETILIRYYLDGLDFNEMAARCDDVGRDGYSLKGILQHVHNGHPAATLIYERPIPEPTTRAEEPPTYDARDWFAEGWIAQAVGKSVAKYAQDARLNPNSEQKSQMLAGWNYGATHIGEPLPDRWQR